VFGSDSAPPRTGLQSSTLYNELVSTFHLCFEILTQFPAEKVMGTCTILQSSARLTCHKECFNVHPPIFLCTDAKVCEYVKGTFKHCTNSIKYRNCKPILATLSSLNHFSFAHNLKSLFLTKYI